MNTTQRDPVCGMMANPDLGCSYQGTAYHFCSDFCRRQFMADPNKYAALAGPPGQKTNDSLRRIAYFSMEVGVDERMPNYSGGLGVLAGDTLKSAADMRIPLVAVSLVSSKGYFTQDLDEWGNQIESATDWNPAEYAHPLTPIVEVFIEGRPVALRAWQYDVVGNSGFVVPLFLLDTNVEKNNSRARELTSWLYGGDADYRLAQEIILGIGGVRMLRALGFTHLERFHLNEGHAALLALELLREGKAPGTATWDFSEVRERCVFTTHTPVPAGHDRFDYELVRRVLGDFLPFDLLRMLGGSDQLNMTLLALNTSKYVNGVAKKHGQVSQEMFPGYAIDSITNGVHSPTWTSESFKYLFDRFVTGWAKDPCSLRHAINIPTGEIWHAHEIEKRSLIEEVKRLTGESLDPGVFTIGFARRATEYKRSTLVFSDPNALLEIARTVGPIQLIFAGKAHPKDHGGKEAIRRIVAMAKSLGNLVKVVYLPNYGMALAKLLTAGVDLWLNTPLRPQEASGTSGMKAAHNGVPSLSVLDGWWIEGNIEGVTGWSIGSEGESNSTDPERLYQKLRSPIVPMYYRQPEQWRLVMRQAIAFNASFFNTHRMVQQYVTNAYF